MDKYTLVKKKHGTRSEDKTEIKITASGRIPTYISYAAKLFKEEEEKKCVLKATGSALAKAVTIAEVLKRRFKGLHQVTEIGSTPVTDTYEPNEEGLDVVEHKRFISSIEMTLSLEKPDNTDAAGYQEPIDESLVEEKDADDLIRPRRSQSGSQPRRRKGKGKGKKGKGKKGKGKGKKGRGKRGGSATSASSASDGDDSPASRGSSQKRGRKGRKKSRKGGGKRDRSAGSSERSTRGRSERKGKGKGKGKRDSKGKGKKGKGKGKKGDRDRRDRDRYDSRSRGGRGGGGGYRSRGGDWDSWDRGYSNRYERSDRRERY